MLILKYVFLVASLLWVTFAFAVAASTVISIVLIRVGYPKMLTRLWSECSRCPFIVKPVEIVNLFYKDKYYSSFGSDLQIKLFSFYGRIHLLVYNRLIPVFCAIGVASMVFLVAISEYLKK